MRESGKKCVLILYRAPYEGVAQEEMAQVMQHKDTLNIVLPVFYLPKAEAFPDFVMHLIEMCESGEYWDWFRQPCVRVLHTNPTICFYAALPGVGMKLAERLYTKYPAPRAFVQALEATGWYDTKWKSKAAWEREAWFSDIEGIGADKATKLVAFIEGVTE